LKKSGVGVIMAAIIKEIKIIHFSNFMSRLKFKQIILLIKTITMGS